MPKFEEHDPKEIKLEEKKEVANIIEYYEQDLREKEKSIKWLEIRKEALKDFIERKNLAEGDLNFLKEEVKEFEIEIRVNKSMMELTKQRLAEKVIEANK